MTAATGKVDPQYQAHFYDTSTGSTSRVAICNDFVSIYYKKQVNHAGMAVITVPEDHQLVSLLADDFLIEILVTAPKPEGYAIGGVTGDVVWYIDFVGVYRDKQVATDGDGNLYYVLYFPGAIDVLSRNIIAWAAGTDRRSSWSGVAVATIAHEIVRYNCTSSATAANGRIRDASVIRTFTSLGAISGTPTVSYAAAGQNVLETLQELARIGAFDFDVLRLIISGVPNRLAFIEYANQLGTDRSATCFFQIELDNLASSNMTAGRLGEKTVAIVGGQGQGSARTYTVRTGDNYSASNDYELFIDARSNTAAELTTIGDAKMSEMKARLSLDADVIGSQGYVYRRDYAHGDIVTVRFAGTTVSKKITAVEVKFSQDQSSNIRVELEDL